MAGTIDISSSLYGRRTYKVDTCIAKIVGHWFLQDTGDNNTFNAAQDPVRLLGLVSGGVASLFSLAAGSDRYCNCGMASGRGHTVQTQAEITFDPSVLSGLKHEHCEIPHAAAASCWHGVLKCSLRVHLLETRASRC